MTPSRIPTGPTLFIDVVSNGTDGFAGPCIACCDDGNVRAMQRVEPRSSDALVLQAVENVLRESGIRFTDMQRIACVTGPGGFTSLRMGVSLANVLADQLHIPLAGVHAADVCLARCDAESYVWVHSAKRTDVFVRGEGALREQWPEPTLLPLAQLANEWQPTWRMAGELIEEQEQVLQAVGALRATVRPLVEVLPALLHSLTYEKSSIEPWYGRGW